MLSMLKAYMLTQEIPRSKHHSSASNSYTCTPMLRLLSHFWMMQIANLAVDAEDMHAR